MSIDEETRVLFGRFEGVGSELPPPPPLIFFLSLEYPIIGEE